MQAGHLRGHIRAGGVGAVMKCEHEGCEEESAATIKIEITFDRGRYGGMCRSHLAAWLREKADEVEGVRECEACGGYGITGVNWCNRCASCHGTGRVPR